MPTESDERPTSASLDVLPASARDDVRPTRQLGAFTLFLCAFAAWVAWAFAGTMVFASWIVIVFWPWRERLVRRVRRPWLASLLLTHAIVLAILAPLVVGLVFVTIAIVDLVGSGLVALRQGSAHGVLGVLFGPAGATGNWEEIARSALRSLPTVVGGLGTVFGIVADTVLRLFLFVIAVYFLFVDGRAACAWLEHGSPLRRFQTRRLMVAYAEAGRGMLVGVFLIVVVHGVVAAIGYLIIGVPRPLQFGFLTALAGFVPGIGTAAVWIPLAIGLAASHHLGQGIGVVVVGLIVGITDNVLRPYLAKLGEVPLPTLAVFLSIFAGIVAFGPEGLLLGPLLYALAKASVELYIEEKERRARRPHE